jgi:UDP-galactopyranose mutase
VGHLADYRYYYMNIVIAMALAKFEHELNVVM